MSADAAVQNVLEQCSGSRRSERSCFPASLAAACISTRGFQGPHQGILPNAGNQTSMTMALSMIRTTLLVEEATTNATR